MKTIFSIFASVILTASVFAQAPQKMTYQAVVRNNSNALVQNSAIGMKVILLQGGISGTVVYVETHSTITNENGLLNIEIGGGVVDSGSYQNTIYWAGGPYFLKTEIDIEGGTNYTITTTSELLSVPYSNYSHVSGKLIGEAWGFVGAYKESIYNEINYQDYVMINYLSPNSVSIHITSDGESFTVYGIISGDTISIPPIYIFNSGGGRLFGTIVRTGNKIVLSLTSISLNNISETFGNTYTKL